MNDNRILVRLVCVAAFFCAGHVRSEAPEPLTLRRAARLALARAPEVAVAQAELDEAASSARRAKASLDRPLAFATTTPGYSSGLPVAVAGRVPAVAGLEVRQTLYDPGRRAETFDAGARAAAARGAFERTSGETARAIAVSYGRVWGGKALLEDARRRVEAREAAFRRLSALRREGRRTDLDVENAGLAVARAKQKLSDRQAELDLDRLELSRLVDWPAAAPLALAEDPLSALPEPGTGDALASARAADPELAALAARIDALEHSLSLVERSWHPTVEAEAQYLRLAKYNNFDQYFVKFKADDFAIGVSVAVPLWTGGRFAEARAGARARLAHAAAERRLRERDLELAVRRAEAERQHAGAHYALSRRAVEVAREELRVARALADEGRGEPDGIENREVALADAEDDLSNASQGLLAARARLLELRGELPAALLGLNGE
jgi:outer membrane protein TolC